MARGPMRVGLFVLSGHCSIFVTQLVLLGIKG